MDNDCYFKHIFMRKSITLTIAFLLASMSSILMANPVQNKNNATTVSRAYALRVYDDSWERTTPKRSLFRSMLTIQMR